MPMRTSTVRLSVLAETLRHAPCRAVRVHCRRNALTLRPCRAPRLRRRPRSSARRRACTRRSSALPAAARRRSSSSSSPIASSASGTRTDEVLVLAATRVAATALRDALAVRLGVTTRGPLARTANSVAFQLVRAYTGAARSPCSRAPSTTTSSASSSTAASATASAPRGPTRSTPEVRRSAGSAPSCATS